MAKLKFDIKKIDLTRVKKFFIARGEKVGLGLVVGIGFLLVTTGLWGAMGSDGKTKIQELKKYTETLRTAINSQDVKGVEEPDVNTAWRYRDPTYQFVPICPIADPIIKKRSRPTIFPVMAGKKDVQFDYFKGAAVQVYAINRALESVEVVGPKGQEKKTELATMLSPRRMLIVTCPFPLGDQLLEYQSKLNIPRNELKDDFPQVLGIDVLRVEKIIDPKTKDPEEEEIELYGSKLEMGKGEKDKKMIDKDKDRPLVAKHLHALLTEVCIDKDALEPFAAVRRPGLMTLMPRLTNADYPPYTLGGKGGSGDGDTEPKKGRDPKSGGKKDGDIKKDPPKVGKEPPPRDKDQAKKTPAGGAKTARVGYEFGPPADWKDIDPAMRSRFEGKYPIFYGQDSVKVAKDVPAPVKPAKDGKPAVEAPPPPVQAGADPLVRFFDVDLEPGHTYEYKIRVRMKNPNQGKETEVTVESDAKDVELYSDWKTTPPYKVPMDSDEVFFYAVDEWERNPTYPSGPDHAVLGEKGHILDKDGQLVGGKNQNFSERYQKVPFQIHRWIRDWVIGRDNHVVLDWVVAERVLVRRGEYIGRSEMQVPVCTWSKLRDDFEVINPPSLPKVDKDNNKVTPPPPAGLTLDFAVTGAMLVDFEGGIKAVKKADWQKGTPEFEETPVDVLILNADGTLSVRNTHREFNVKARMERDEIYRERLEQHMVRPTEAAPPPDNKKPDEKDKGKKDKAGKILDQK
jgi:hypothetical protein